MDRTTRLQAFLREQELSGALISSAVNGRYLSGFTGSNRWLLVSAERRLLVTDQRYGEQARRESPGYDLHVTNGPFLAELTRVIAGQGWPRIGYETNDITDATLRALKRDVDAEFVPLDDLALAWRAVKDDAEIASIRASVAMADRCLAELLPTLRVGQSEREIRARLEYIMAMAGSDSPAFGTIVGGGPNAALPHAPVSAYRLQAGDACVIDFGTTVDGYFSDVTRTIRFGPLRAELERLFELVEAAQAAAFAAIAPGVPAGAVDRAHREVFLRHDMDGYALRGLGHGIGLEIHEWPRVVIGGEQILEPGMIFTVEPGLYVPGLGGVRKEDVVLITATGFEVLTTAPARLTVEV